MRRRSKPSSCTTRQAPVRGRGPTICVSSQVGCPIGCSFCATGQSGFDRNLSEAEIVDQFLAASRDLGETQRSLTNVVFMGMGEPLNNYAAVVGAIRRWARPDTLNFSPRRVTVSTIGLVPFIERLSAEGCRSTWRSPCTRPTMLCVAA